MRYSMNVENPCKLSIGYVGENIVTEIAFDYSAWKKEYGDGVLALELKRYGDTYAYPVVISTEGDSTSVWTIRDTDVAKNGRGQAQLQYVIGDAVKKSAIFVVDVERSLEETTDVPDPYEEWLDDIIRISAETAVNAQHAEESAESASASAESIIDKVGDLSELETTDKTDVVSAINELVADIDGVDERLGSGVIS